MSVDMERLRIERQEAEERIVHLRDGPRKRVCELLSHLEVLEVQSGHGDPLWFLKSFIFRMKPGGSADRGDREQVSSCWVQPYCLSVDELLDLVGGESGFGQDFSSVLAERGSRAAGLGLGDAP